MKGKEDTNDIVREGFVQKRGGRMHSWNKRYFVLTSNKIAYRVKNDSSPYKAAFDLVPGCKVTEVREETIGALKGKKAYTFWIVWPHDKNSGKTSKDSKGNTDDILSDDEDEPETNETNRVDTKTDENVVTETKKPKGLKTIVETEVMAQRTQQRQAAAQLERHVAHDNNISLGFKVAALTVGGVIIGAATMGTGLVPYLLVVGVSAVAGGGAILSVRRPSDSRIILAFDTMWSALDWKQSIELQINRLESKLKPTLPLFTDPNVISYLMSAASTFHDQTWKKVHICEDMRIMKHLSPIDGTQCFRAQLVIHASPVSVFLALMENNCWPKCGQFKIEKALDDHVDIIGVSVKTNCKKDFGDCNVDRSMCLSRFWKLDDDGVYLITLTSVESTAENIAEAFSQINSTSTLTAVITVSPRIDHTIYDDDLSESLVCCTIQVSSDAKWRPGEMHGFVNDFLQQHLLGVRQTLMLSKYNVNQKDGAHGADMVAYNSIIQGPSMPKSATSDSQSLLDEDQSSAPHTPLADVGDKEEKQKAVDVSMKEKPTRRFFRRPLIGRSKSVEPAAAADNDKNTMYESISVSPNHTPTRGRTKSATINLEASALRGQIASKEYEMQRLDRVLRRKEKDKDKGGNVVVSSSANSSNNMLQQQKEQNLSELSELKVKYKKLTGTAYEDSTRKGPLSRLRGYASRRAAKASQATPVKGAVVVTSTVSSFKAVAVPTSRRPHHWRPMKLDQSKVYIFDEEVNNDSKVNIAVVGVFILCLLGTFCLANLLSFLP